VEIYQELEPSKPYCLFSGLAELGGSLCPQWVFADHNSEWPEGQAIQDGPHTLEAIIHTTDGRNQTVQFPIEVQLDLDPDDVPTYLPIIVK
jgi:hypothetical protein